MAAYDRVLSHGQYEELRRYRHGRPSWMLGRAPTNSLTRNGFLAIVAHSGHDRASSAFTITDAGQAALVAYEERWKISAGDAA